MKKLLLFFAPLLISSHLFALDPFGLREDSFFSKYKLNGVSVSTSVILIDLSDATNFPHKATNRTGGVSVTSVRTVVDKVAASSGAVNIGVVYEVNATTGSVRWFYTNDFRSDTVGTHLIDFVNYTPSALRTNIDSTGSSFYTISSTATVRSTIYQTDVGLPTTNAINGSVNPAVGDIILRYDSNANSQTGINIDVEIGYYTTK